MGNSEVGGFLPGLACMCGSNIVKFPSPEGTNTSSHHVSKSTFAIFSWVGQHVRKGVGLYVYLEGMGCVLYVVIQGGGV